ncbi:TetR/AcrR family transcriptional regulator [Kibdelosporangium phytohabitans]|uniref:TetR family transcriptional regulator n=1 Tax=Kibdelosporangium phytohabitans TaxID=860235 RepID=A0A0N7F4G8_9PSEU|nr:TetR/AcrR family transcriptional regulator [Kibdelosporangium phytohabitans]ALG11391.1 TetR family transcriptional regulator [Kibdelosporangium phytohabitans]MBE1462718.1 AcrR family transcriptional regulator [Kibdelosporangium phytohabitans]
MRADARRNYERLLTEAETAFRTRGIDASLEDIARNAGVGIGTLYRHFPNRDALLEALLHDRFAALGELSTRLLDADSPRAALIEWLREFVKSSNRYQGLPASVVATLRNEKSRLYTSCHAMKEAGSQLLARAQRAGVVRADLKPDELLLLSASISWANEHSPDSVDRFITLLVEGIDP